MELFNFHKDNKGEITTVIGGSEIKVTAVEAPDGRKNPYMRCFGTRLNDALEKLVEFHLPPSIALTVIEDGKKDGQFPILVIPSERYTLAINPGNIKLVQFGTPANA